MDCKSGSLLATSQHTIISFYSIFLSFALSVSLLSLYLCTVCMSVFVSCPYVSLYVSLSLSNCLSLCLPCITNKLFFYLVCVKHMAMVWPRQLAPLSYHDSFDSFISIPLRILVLNITYFIIPDYSVERSEPCKRLKVSKFYQSVSKPWYTVCQILIVHYYQRALSNNISTWYVIEHTW